MDSIKLYQKETGKSPTIVINGRDYFTWEYILWLKEQINKIKKY